MRGKRRFECNEHMDWRVSPDVGGFITGETSKIKIHASHADMNDTFCKLSYCDIGPVCVQISGFNYHHILP